MLFCERRGGGYCVSGRAAGCLYSWRSTGTGRADLGSARSHKWLPTARYQGKPRQGWLKASMALNKCGRGKIGSYWLLMLTRAPLGGGAISSPPPPPPLVFLRYLLNQCRYHHQTCSTLSPNIFTHCVKILKSRVS